jgi:hypothetical protein
MFPKLCTQLKESLTPQRLGGLRNVRAALAGLSRFAPRACEKDQGGTAGGGWKMADKTVDNAIVNPKT